MTKAYAANIASPAKDTPKIDLNMRSYEKKKKKLLFKDMPKNWHLQKFLPKKALKKQGKPTYCPPGLVAFEYKSLLASLHAFLLMA